VYCLFFMVGETNGFATKISGRSVRAAGVVGVRPASTNRGLARPA